MVRSSLNKFGAVEAGPGVWMRSPHDPCLTNGIMGNDHMEISPNLPGHTDTTENITFPQFLLAEGKKC